MRVEEAAALGAHHDPQSIALGEVEPARRMDPDVLERLHLDRHEIRLHCCTL